MSRLHDDDGFSLGEILISLLIIGVAMSAFFQVIVQSLQSLSESRSRQSASQVATEIIEDMRALSPSEVIMDSDTFDISTVSCGGTAGTYDPDGAGPIGCETIVEGTGGRVDDTRQGTFTHAGADLEIVTIATAASGSAVPAGTVRLTVVASYSIAGETFEVRRSALFSEVARG